MLWALSRTTRFIGDIASHPGIAFIALGSVVLCVTGAEALYADMGHFGKAPDPPRLVRPRRCRRW